jgi:hypothetical protein
VEGGATVGESSGEVDNPEVRSMKQRFWGLRPWKRHSLILMVAGVIYVFVGIQYILTESTPGRERALKVILQVAPLPFWGSVFVFAGLLTILSSRWPPLTETWGYIVLTSLSAGWASTYLMGILFMDSPSSNSSQVFLWGCLAFLWWGISGLLNPDRTAVTHGRV